MVIDYLELLKKAEAGEVDLLSCVLRHKLGKEYPIDRLEGIYLETSIRARKRRVPLKSMKYKFEGGEVTLKDQDMPMDLYLKRLEIVGGEVKPRYTHLGEFLLGEIAENIEEFKKFASASGNAVYIRLQDLETAEKIEEYLDELERHASGVGGEEPKDRRPKFEFDVNRIDKLRDVANYLFGKPGSKQYD